MRRTIESTMRRTIGGTRRRTMLLGLLGVAAAVAGLAIIGALASGGGSRTAAPAGPQAAGGQAGPGAAALKVGDVLESPNWRLKVTNVERVDGDLVWSRTGNKTKSIGQWLVITTEVTNTGKDTHTLNSQDFELRTVAGQTIKHTTEGAGQGYAEFKEQTPLGRQIPPGATVTTPLLFDIPKGTQGINLVFAQAKDKPINVA